MSDKQPRREREDSEHIVQLNSRETQALREWLRAPNGSHISANWRVTFDAVENGGLLVRTQPYSCRS
jgi:hypothetical protein